MKILVLLLTLFVGSASAYKAPRYCVPENSSPNYCGNNPGGLACTTYHPKAEFCADETLPLPTCCRAADDPKHFNGCACCRNVHGNKRVYTHYRGEVVVEYDIQPTNAKTNTY